MDLNKKFTVGNNTKVQAGFSEDKNFTIIIQGVSPSTKDGIYAIVDPSLKTSSFGSLKIGTNTFVLPAYKGLYVALPINSGFNVSPNPLMYNPSVGMVVPPTSYTKPKFDFTPQEFYIEDSDLNDVKNRQITFDGKYLVLTTAGVGGKITGTYTEPNKQPQPIVVEQNQESKLNVPYNTTFDLVAQPNNGYSFAGWSSPVQGPLMSNLQTTASFKPSGDGSSNKTYWIIGGVSGGILLILIIAIIAFVITKSKSKQS